MDASNQKSPANPEHTQQRLARLAEYRAESLADSDPLRANLGAGVADMLQMALLLRRGIDSQIKEEKITPKQFGKVAPAIELYLKIHRQTDRFIQLDQRLRTESRKMPTRQPE
ncbi:MAG TPA: hypothetical protein DD670_05725 [Planctomycetaceae bacterium]|nr:hypothetical protein [Planctomycetaceae bacterium]